MIQSLADLLPTTWPDADVYPVERLAARAPEPPSAESETTPDMETAPAV